MGESGDVQSAAAGAEASFWLPGHMRKTLPVQDQRWIANTLFPSGKLRPDLKLWYEPPVPALIYHNTPTPDHFFTHRLMVWMPYHLWQVRVFCPACGKQLTGAGVHKRSRKVLDLDRYYLMVTETLRCTACLTNYLSTSQTVRNQLDFPRQKLFRLILTHKYACDIRVIRLLRDRTLGNSPARLAKQLKENHGEEWLNRLAHYLGECAEFVKRPSLFPAVCQEPPEPIDIPSSGWLLSVYNRDIITRIDHIRASITSTFGSILKLVSTKKVTKKLAGHGRGTALMVTSIGNGVGQILNSVLTVLDGPGLDAMVSGVIERYRQAAVPPPVVLYVDCGCCGSERSSKLPTSFTGWPDLHIRLDICHFMRRLAAGCTTATHTLYPTFMGSLSSCIFEWDAGDVTLLRQAKREQLRREGVPGITDRMVDTQISKKELSLYCRRKTSGEEATVDLIERLLQTLGGSNGSDLSGVPLLDQERMEHIWRVQKRHVRCIQDVPGLPLYTVVGTTTKSGVVLRRFRCARGSTSLDSFHCHLNRFIPGTSANAMNFQLYLLEGLNRWNQDRGAAAVTSRPPSLQTYAGDLTHCVNTSSMAVFGRAFVPTFRPPRKYTGELLGVDYLLNQTGKPMTTFFDSEETDNMLEDECEGEEEDKDFEEDTVSSPLDDPSSSQPAACSQASASMQPAGVSSASPDKSEAVEYAAKLSTLSIPGMPECLEDLRNPLPSANVRSPSAPPQLHLRTVAAPTAVKLHHQRQLLPAPPSGPQLGMQQQQLFPAPPSGPQLGMQQQQLFPAPPSGPQLGMQQQQLFPAPPSGPQLGMQQQQLFPAPPSGPQLVMQQQLFPAPPSGPQLVMQQQQQLFPAPPSGPQLVMQQQQQLFPAPPSGPQLGMQQQQQLFPAPPSGPQLTPVTLLVPVLVAAPQALPAPAPAPVRRKLTRKVLHNSCKKCGRFRTAETGHSQYKGVIFCPSVESVPKEQWLKDMKPKT